MLDDLTECATFHITLVQMSDEFKQKLMAVYQEDSRWKDIITLIKKDKKNKRLA